MINRIVKISVILLLFVNYSYAQNLEEIVGIYAVKQRCWEFNNNWQETTEYEVEVNYATNDSTNLEIHAVILSKPYTLGFNAKNDSLFWIYNHLFLNEDSTIQYVQGNGRIYKDSLDLGFRTFNLYDTYKCDCNGNKVKDIEPPETTYPIPAPDSEWGYVTFFGPPGLPGAGSVGSIIKYDFKDTLINNHTYKHWVGNTYTRYHNNKLYVLEPYSFNNDSLVELVHYDFNLTVNDTFPLPYPGSNYYAIVDEVTEFETLNGQTRKDILLKTDDFTCSHRLRWIEGIGDIGNGILYKYQLGLCDIYDRIVCFSDSSGNVYKEPLFEHPCDSLGTFNDIIDGVDDFNYHTAISIFPNPAKQQLNFIFIENIELYVDHYIIYHLNGAKILQNEMHYDNRTIDVSQLENGSYIIHFLKDEVAVVAGRFVKIE